LFFNGNNVPTTANVLLQGVYSSLVDTSTALIQETLTITDNFGNVVYELNPSSTSHNYNAALNVPLGAAFTVQLTATAFVGQNPDVRTATIDPFFSIADPTLANLVDIDFSPGIGNVPPVPEISTWAMMMLGFLCLGFIAHRSQRRRLQFA